MQFAFTEEQNMIRETAETACADLCGRAEIFAAIETAPAFDKNAWRVLIEEMALGSIAIPEAQGGAGLGVVELASIMEKTGRVLLPAPFLTSIAMSATAISRASNETAHTDILPGLIDGSQIASFVYLTTNATSSAGENGAKLGADSRLSGKLGFAQFGMHADSFIVLAASDSGAPCLVAVSATGEGVTRTHRDSMDLTRPFADVTFENAQILCGGPLTTDAQLIEDILNISRICMASEQLGAAEAVMEKTQAYVLERHQFGVPVGSFQAVKHRLADMMVLVEAAKSAAWYAACVADEAPEDLAVAASTAMVVTNRALTRNASHMIQLHGGMGFTWECEAHLYFKRATVSEYILGSSSDHRETLAAIALGEMS